MQKSSHLRTPIKTARGLGSAHSGTHHFWLQRVSAVALIPLSIWFMGTLVCVLLGADRSAMGAWFANPLHVIVLAAFLLAMFTHARLGIQTVIEDYIHHEGKKIIALLLLNVFIFTFGAGALMAIFKLHFFGI